MHSVDRHFWMIFIVASTIGVLYVRAKLKMRGTRGAFKALAVANLPWVVQGIATTLDPGITIHNILRMDHGWPAYAMLGSIVLVWAAGFYWLFAAGGAEQLAANPIPILNLPTTATGIKLFFVVAVLGGVVGTIVSFIMNN